MPAHPFERHLEKVAEAAEHHGWIPADGALPALYLSHGAPPLFEDGGMDGAAVRVGTLDAQAQGGADRVGALGSGPAEPCPAAMLTSRRSTTSAASTRCTTGCATTPPTASALAKRVLGALGDDEEVHQSRTRGLDHGAWVPLKIMYPGADIPVLQLSLPTSDPARLLALGARLRALREEGVLVIGSGFTTHGLPFLTRSDFLGRTTPGWSVDFDAWAAEALARGDVDELANYRTRAPGMPYAHPTVEHFVPLFVTLGAATDPEAPRDFTIDGFWMGLSKRSLQVA